MKYPFKNKYLRLLISLIDRLGYRFFPKRKTACPNFKTILLIRLDQIGDIVMSQPFITALKNHRPDVKITLLTTPAGKELLGQIPDIDEFVIFEPSWLLSSSRGPKGRGISFFFSLLRCLKKIPADVIVDLRGDFRHILAARLAQPRAWLLGYGTTGGGFLLDLSSRDPKPLVAQGRGISTPPHAISRNMHLLIHLGIKVHPSEEWSLSPKISSSALSFSLRKKGSRWIALHFGAKTTAKRWPLSHWNDLLTRLMADRTLHFFVIGDRECHQIFQELKCHSEREVQCHSEHAVRGIPIADRLTNLCEKLPLSQLGTFLKMCDLLISVDSGPVHIAAAHGVKTIVLFSGTTEPEIWRPWSSQAMVLNHHVSCSPCHEKICPKERHFCMEGLTPHEVFKCFKAFQPSSGA